MCLIDLIRELYPEPSWEILTEVWVWIRGRQRRLDALATTSDPSGAEAARIVTFELKCSRRDLRRELRNPLKLADTRACAHEAYLVLAAGVRREGDPIPDDMGVLEVSPLTGQLVKVRASPIRETVELDIEEVRFGLI